jgi:hypothetical protein
MNGKRPRKQPDSLRFNELKTKRKLRRKRRRTRLKNKRNKACTLLPNRSKRKQLPRHAELPPSLQG